jgi:DNA-binding LytR/AlgR family response regulator
MVIQIAICDDEKQICTQLEAMLADTLGKHGIKHEIDIFFSGEKLCNSMKNGARYDLIFLDIMYEGQEINGVDTGKQIREAFDQQTVSIVYISWEKEYSLQLHKIRPVDFLIKPLKQSDIDEVVKSHIKLSRIATEDFVYKTRHETRKEKIKNIVYVESVNRQLVLHLQNDNKEVFYGTLKDVYADQLKKADFLQIHASFAVNYNYIQALNRSKVVLTTGETLPVSKNKKNEAEETYFAILERQGLV